MNPLVVIDARMIRGAPHGFARYIGRMAEGLSKIPSRGYDPLFLVNSSYGRSDFQGFRTHVTRSEFLSPSELLEIPRLLRQLGAALYHTPTFSSLYPLGWPAALGPGCPWVQTVHDLNHLHFGGLRERVYYRLLLKPFSKRAHVLATVSEFSRNEIAPWLGIKPEAIEVVPNAIEEPARISEEEIGAALSEFGVKAGSYFLCLSNMKPHKNLPLLADAYADYRKMADVTTAWPLLVSVRGLTPVDGLIQAGPIADKAGQALLAAAGAVVFPSLYEGFGIPPVEAAVQGIPVLVSDIPPHREGLQDLTATEAHWVNPADREAWAAALERAARGEVRPPGVESRARILERYSVARLGRGMDRLYRRVLGISA